MHQLNSMEVFVKVAEALNLSAAAQQLQVTPSAVSKVLSKLEARLEVRLLSRTTRQVRLTEAGRLYLERCRRILQSVQQAETSVKGQPASPGAVRLSCPSSVLRELLAGRVGQLLSARPALTLELANEDATVRVRFVPTAVVERPLRAVRFGLFASPSYLERRGGVQRPQDLERHECILPVGAEPSWRMRLVREPGGAGQLTAVPVSCRLRASSDEQERELALRGLGIARLPDLAVVEAVRTRALVPVLAAFELESSTLAVECDGGEDAEAVREWIIACVEQAAPALRHVGSR